MSKIKYKIGDIFESRKGGKYRIIELLGKSNFKVEFENGFITTAYSSSIRSGMVSNLLYPKVNGVGYIGVGTFTSTGKEYSVWKGIVSRCYPYKNHKEFFGYENCTICEEWHNFQNFAEWYSQQPNAYKKGYHLDKDFKIIGNRIYSPTTCSIIPIRLNILFSRPEKNYSGYVGVDYNKADNVYRVSYTNENGRRIYVGRFKTPEEAEVVYIRNKRSSCLEVLKSLGDEISSEIYNNLLLLLDKYYPVIEK